MPAREARLLHPKLVCSGDLLVPKLNDEVWEWLRENVHHEFEVVSVGDGDILDDDFIVFENYAEYLHFRLRWDG